MIANGFQPDAFVRNANAVARVVLPNELFSLLNRSVTPPPSCVALVWGESAQPAFSPGGRTIQADGVRELLFVKTLPFQLEYEVGGLSSKDGHEFTAAVTISVQIVPERAELEQVRRRLLGSGNRLDLSDLRRHVEEPVRFALTRYIRERDAARLIDAQGGDEFDAVLADEFQPVGFACGLALGGDIRAAFTSTSYAQARTNREELARKQQRLGAQEQLRTAAHAARTRHLEELAALLDKVKAAAAGDTALGVPEIIKSFDVSRRGELYRGLMALGEHKRLTEWVLVVAGQELLWFDPHRPDNPGRRQTIPDDLGPLRSVRVATRGDQSFILVGARFGLHVFDRAGDARQAYPLSRRVDLRGGVNAAILLDGTFYGTHSEVGLTAWELGKPSAPTARLQEQTAGCKSIRDVQADDEKRIWFAADAKVIGWSPTADRLPTVLAAPATVQCLALADDALYAGLDNGGIVNWTSAAPHDMEWIRPPSGEAVHSLEWLPGGGAPRLLIADKRPYLTLQVLGDTYHAAYRWTQPLRWGFAAEDWIIGVNDARDQLIIWRGDTPEEPVATLHIGRLFGQSIQDVALATSENALFAC